MLVVLYPGLASCVVSSDVPALITNNFFATMQTYLLRFFYFFLFYCPPFDSDNTEQPCDTVTL